MEWLNVVPSGEPPAGSPYGTPCDRIPALAVVSDRLLPYDVREDWRELPGSFDIMLRTSDDLGRTWSEPLPFRPHEGATGYGDASSIADGDDVWCWYVPSGEPSLWLLGIIDDARMSAPDIPLSEPEIDANRPYLSAAGLETVR